MRSLKKSLNSVEAWDAVVSSTIKIMKQACEEGKVQIFSLVYLDGRRNRKSIHITSESLEERK